MAKIYKDEIDQLERRIAYHNSIIKVLRLEINAHCNSLNEVLSRRQELKKAMQKLPKKRGGGKKR